MTTLTDSQVRALAADLADGGPATVSPGTDLDALAAALAPYFRGGRGRGANWAGGGLLDAVVCEREIVLRLAP